jgi:predicted Zn-dependent protease
MAMVVNGIEMSRALEALFLRAGSLHVSPATITSNLAYILALEYGHSRQAPDGMYRRQLNALGYMLEEEMLEAVREFGITQQALDVGIARGAERILVALVEATPVDTGRAKGSWVMRLSNGRVEQASPTVSEAAQKARQRANKKAAAREAVRELREAARAASALKTSTGRAVAKSLRSDARRRAARLKKRRTP